MFKVLSSKVVGGVFIIAAILKLISIDEFEIYIYSFNLLSFFLTTFVSRIIIAGEFVLGLFLILGINYKFTWRTTFITLILFTLFLIYVAIFRQDSNCHCFGELIQLNPLESIIKNLILIVFLIIGKLSAISYQQSIVRVRVSVLSSLFLVLLVFIISPPDSIYKMIYSTEKEVSTIDLYESFDEVVKIDFHEEEIVFDSITSFNTEGKHMIAIVSSGCKYCKLGLKKLSLMMKKENISPESVDVFIWGSPDGIIRFREETMTEDFVYWHIMPNKAIKITYGRFPIFFYPNENRKSAIRDLNGIVRHDVPIIEIFRHGFSTEIHDTIWTSPNKNVDIVWRNAFILHYQRQFLKS